MPTVRRCCGVLQGFDAWGAVDEDEVVVAGEGLEYTGQREPGPHLVLGCGKGSRCGVEVVAADEHIEVFPDVSSRGDRLTERQGRSQGLPLVVGLPSV